MVLDAILLLRDLRPLEVPQGSDLAWNWWSGRPAGPLQHDFIDDRLSRLVRRVVEEGCISLGRAAEIRGLTRDEIRQKARQWTG